MRLRAGPWHADITDEGLLMRGAGARTLFLWGSLTAVRENQFGLMVMMGPANFVPIARAAFASDADREAFRMALDARVSGHRGAA
jgi:YcxB-like protein